MIKVKASPGIKKDRIFLIIKLSPHSLLGIPLYYMHFITEEKGIPLHKARQMKNDIKITDILG